MRYACEKIPLLQTLIGSEYYNNIIHMSNTLILAIETSCDETAISIIRATKNKLDVLTNAISSQVKLHAKWGGVVPNLAAREHVKNIDHLLDLALQEANVLPEHIDAISVTQGPGLIPALLVGVNYAKTLSYLWNKPLIGINHIEGHIYSNFVGENLKSEISNSKKIQNSKIKNSKEYKIQDTKYKIQFPALVLVVSGGHTQLVFMKNHLQYEIIGQTLDDAVGEAFDKVARILGIGYPGGPAVSAYAERYKKQGTRDKDPMSLITDHWSQIKFPRPMLNKKNFNFSFSGLKTAVLYETKKSPELLKDKKYLEKVCHEFQQACVDVLISKTLKAGAVYKPKTIMLAGGVSANKELREQLSKAIANNLQQTTYNVPQFEFTGDNAAMIAAAATFRWKKMTDAQKKKSLDCWQTFQPNANLKMK